MGESFQQFFHNHPPTGSKSRVEAMIMTLNCLNCMMAARTRFPEKTWWAFMWSTIVFQRTFPIVQQVNISACLCVVDLNLLSLTQLFVLCSSGFELSNQSYGLLLILFGFAARKKKKFNFFLWIIQTQPLTLHQACHSWQTDHVTAVEVPRVYTPAPQLPRGQADAHLAFPVSSRPYAPEW